MGIGCDYRLTDRPSERAYWVRYPDLEVDDEYDYAYEVEHYYHELLKYIQKHPKVSVPRYTPHSGKYYYGMLYMITVRSEEHGWVIDFEVDAEENMRGLAASQLAKAYKAFLKYINREFPLVIATSGWTSQDIPVGSLK